MNYNIDDVINELEIVSNNQRQNYVLPNDELINEYEKEIGLKFNKDLKKAFKEISNIFYGTLDFVAITKNKQFYNELSKVLNNARAAGVSRDWIPICEDNGDYYCLLPDGTVRFFSHNGITNESWENLASWIKNVWIDGN